MIEDVLLAVEQLGGLRLDRRHDPRMRVARVGHPDPGRVVEVALAVAGDQPRPLAAVHVQVGDAAPDRRDDRVVGEGTGVGAGRTGVGGIDHRGSLLGARQAPAREAA